MKQGSMRERKESKYKIEIEFMFEFISDCQYHHVPIFVLHGYRTFVCHAL